MTRVWEEDYTRQRKPIIMNSGCGIPSWRTSVAVCWSTPLTTPTTTAPGGDRSVTATDNPTKAVAMFAVDRTCWRWSGDPKSVVTPT